MLPAERPEFDAQIRLLFAGFNVFVTDERCEAYWIALSKIPLLTVVRTVEHCLGEKGPEKVPTAGQLRIIAHGLRSRAQPPTPTLDAVASPHRDMFHCFGQRCLLRWLRESGPVAEPVLVAQVEEKNRLLEQFRIIDIEEPLSGEAGADEIRTALFKAFDRLASRRAAA